MARVSVYEVADRASVSIATVSRALNQPNRVTEETRERVLRAVNELNYVPNAQAADRARRNFRRIAVMAPFFTYPSFVARLRGVAQALEPDFSELVILDVDATVLKRGGQENYLNTFSVSGRFDGLIVMSLPLEEAIATRLRERNLPTVLIEHVDARFPSIVIDDFKGGTMAADYLFSKGHRRVGLVGDKQVSKQVLDTSRLRAEGFVSKMKSLGKSIREDDQVLAVHGIETTRETVKKLLSRPDRPDALFCTSDTLAMGVMKAAADLGLRIPDDLAIVGFDDIDIADFLGLTTIRQSLEESGRAAVNLLNQIIKEPTSKIQHISLGLEMIVRQTA